MPRTRLPTRTSRAGAGGAQSETNARAAAASAVARLGLGGEKEPPGIADEPPAAAAEPAPHAPAAAVAAAAAAPAAAEGGEAEGPSGREADSLGSPEPKDALPVVKSDSVFPKGTPMPTLVRLPEDESLGGGDGKQGAGSLLREEVLTFSEVYTFSKHVRDGQSLGFLFLSIRCPHAASWMVGTW